MNIFNIDKIDTLSLVDMRHILQAEVERAKLLVKQNHFVLFRYEVAEDALILLYNDKNKEIVHRVIEHYSRQTSDYLFNDEELYRVRATFSNIINDPKYPKTGVEEFTLKTGVQIVTEYTCVYDFCGHVESVIGQYMNKFQTRDDLQDTFRMLNAQVAINDVLHRAFESLIKINLKDYSFEIIKGSPEILSAQRACKNAVELGDIFCRHFVEPEYHKGFMEFIDDIDIQERLQTNQFLIFEYKTKNIGICRARIVPGLMDSKGDVCDILFTTERVPEHTDEIAVLRIAATTDPLTGLLNRRAGDAAIAENLKQAQGGVYMMFDCDHFKSINDNLGHPVGDKYLVEVAKALKDVYANEVVVRLGGDEFVVYVSTRDMFSKVIFEGAEALLSPLFKRLSQIVIKEMNGKTPSMSAGVVIIPAGAEYSVEEIYPIADKKLYEAKITHNGRISSVTLNNKK